ncbi:hypothetical protein FIU86_09060 [Roseovarius sp. THAF9]|uniref:Flp family type IVb pilin n=1 Tax=Roseovarius sp. THAF9 TaxID=2587847 RepID=UPI001267D8DD|nr:hypothetical protein [Roseovarius sp. THAF9]QFT92992.1 hypothetical protein FIU86_09060 [Roseovarius sp. THAF9]
MFSAFQKFIAEEDGAVTVDWVVMAAAITWLCLGALQSAQSGVDNLASGLEQGISLKYKEDK